jgi:hypothetical protein
MIKLKKSTLFQVHLNGTDYEIRTEQVNGINYWVVPVVMMLEGVHAGSRGPMLYTAEELSASVAAWNGMPVTIGHPTDTEGTYISATAPSVLSDIVGRIYNPKMKGDKLTAEAWIDVNTLTSRSQEAFEYVKEKKALDVSVGVFSEELKEDGEHGGEKYKAIAINLRPDHLALLPGEVGACSWDDGCGIRNNSKIKMKINKEKVKSENTISKADWLTALLEQGCAVHFVSNEASLGETLSAIQMQLNAMDSAMFVYYLEEVYDNYFVYCVVNRESRERELYKRSYLMGNDGKVNFRGDPIQVRKEVNFINMEKQKVRTNFNKNKKAEMKTNGKCKCSVDSLIENQATNFTEDDREWLTNLSQEQLEKLAPNEEKKEAVVNKTKTEETTTSKDDEAVVVKKGKDGAISINGKSIQEIVRESLASEKDPIKLIDNFFPGEVGEQLKSGLAAYQNRRKKLIKDIVANSKFKEDQLKAYDDAALTTLHESLVEEDEDVVHNYAGRGNGAAEETEDDDITGKQEELSAMMSFVQPVETKAPEKKDATKK